MPSMYMNGTARPRALSRVRRAIADCLDRHWLVRDLGWLIVSAASIVALAGALMLIRKHSGPARALLSLYPESWSIVLTVVVSVFFVAWWLIGSWRDRRMATVTRRTAVTPPASDLTSVYAENRRKIA